VPLRGKIGTLQAFSALPWVRGFQKAECTGKKDYPSGKDRMFLYLDAPEGQKSGLSFGM
jgi:hypothetical protein